MYFFVIVGGITDWDGNGCGNEIRFINPFDSRTTTISPSLSIQLALRGVRVSHLYRTQLLITGGHDKSTTDVLKTTTLFPSWASEGIKCSDMHMARNNHTATTLISNDRVLVIGGLDEHILGTKTVELFDCKTNTWTRKADMPDAKYTHTSILIDHDTVLVLGGVDNSSGSRKLSYSCYLYHISANKWERTGDLLNARASAAVAILPNGDVWATGGFTEYEAGFIAPSIHTEIYSVTLRQWMPAKPMRNPRAAHTCINAGSYFLITGGITESHGILHSVELFDMTLGPLNAWAFPTLMKPRAHHFCFNLLPHFHESLEQKLLQSLIKLQFDDVHNKRRRMY